MLELSGWSVGFCLKINLQNIIFTAMNYINSLKLNIGAKIQDILSILWYRYLVILALTWPTKVFTGIAQKA